MLTDDELDFEDFGDLGEIEGQNMTTEELEKQLALEFPDDAAPSSESKNNIINFDDLDEGEIIDEKEDADQEEGETKSKLESFSRPYHNQQRYNNYYGSQQQFTPDMMAMNGMFPSYPQYSNRIYVNPKFNQGQQNQQLLLHQQQSFHQRQYMKMETKRLALLKHQQQLQLKKNYTFSPPLNIDLDQKRRETAEMMKKRRENRNDQVGEKRLLDEYTEQVEKDKRQRNASTSEGAGGGATAAGSINPLQPINTPYTPPHISSRIGDRPSITNRLSRPTTGNDKNQASSTIVVPITTGGKSDTLIIKGFSNDVKDQDIKDMTDKVFGGVKDVQLNMDEKTAIVVFRSVEAAVTFRRQYNRIQLGEKHINIIFQK